MRDGNNIELREVPLSPQLEIVSFLHRVWSHSLLDEKTINHRRGFPKRFEDWCRPWGLNPQSLAAVLTGSSLWSTDRTGYRQGSDWDFHLYGPKEVILPYRELRRKESLYNEHADLFYDDWDIHPESITADSEIICVAALAPLLLTPDNFIAGNLDLARIYRRLLLGLKNPNEKELREHFERFMKGWPEYEDVPSRTGDRKGRLEAALHKRANEIERKGANLGEEVTQRFLQHRAEIEPPPLAVFIQAIEATNGVLVLPTHLGKNVTRL